MSEDPDFLSILNIRLSQLKNMFDNSYNQLIAYCNNQRNMILNANIPHQQKMYYINQVRNYFKNQYNGIKGKYDSDILNAKQEHEQFMKLFRHSRRRRASTSTCACGRRRASARTRACAYCDI